MNEKILTSLAWKRFWARMFDYFLFGFIFLVITSHIPNFNEYPFVYFACNLLFAILFEAIFIAQTSTTPGKKFLGLHVVGRMERTLSFKTACYRTFWAYVKGLWLGIPVMMFVPAYFSKKVFESTGTTIWDRAANTEIINFPSNMIRKILFVLVFIFMMYLVGSYSMLQQAMQQVGK